MDKKTTLCFSRWGITPLWEEGGCHPRTLILSLILELPFRLIWVYQYHWNIWSSMHKQEEWIRRWPTVSPDEVSFHPGRREAAIHGPPIINSGIALQTHLSLSIPLNMHKQEEWGREDNPDEVSHHWEEGGCRTRAPSVTLYGRKTRLTWVYRYHWNIWSSMHKQEEWTRRRPTVSPDEVSLHPGRREAAKLEEVHVYL